VLAAGLGGFALGVATVLLVVWVYGVPPPATPVSPSAANAPGVPESRGRGGVPQAAPPAIGAPAPGRPPAAPPPAAPAPGTLSPQAPPEASAPDATAGDAEALSRRRLLLPVQGVRREQLTDSFNDARGGHRHEAMDIMAPRNTPVLAVEDGRLAKLFVSRQGGNTIYQFDPAESYAYYYAHLERYAAGMQEGAMLRRGQVIGYVGTSGNAPPEAPHLHFAIFRLGPDKSWWKGTPIDPFSVLSQP
jgi:murein DD-endopeptidase MepM/ murein hydrolase activator NlpD